MQDPTPHQTDIDSVIHQDASATPSNVAVSDAPSNGNGNGGGKGRANGGNSNGNGTKSGNGKAVVRAAEGAPARAVRPENAPGLTIERRFTTAGEDVYGTVEWERRDAIISNERGEKVFEQTGVEIPKSWTQLATNVVVSKYFRGHIGTPERESSVRQLISRVADTMANWGRAMEYFATEADAQTFQDELTHILLHQKAAFNSPVWFNVGLPDQPAPQCSACQPYHARVLTERGPISIGELVSDKAIGTRVFDGNALTRIVAVKHNGRKPVFRITLNDGYEIEATGDHVVCAHNERRVKNLEWRRVDELVCGMKMRVYPHGAITRNAGNDSLAVSEAALAGWLQADGFVGQYESGTNRSLTAEFITNGDEEHDWVLAHLAVVFPKRHYNVCDVITQGTETQVRRVRLYGEHLRPFIEKYSLSQRGTDIRVPELIFTASEAATLAYLTSVFQSEGYVSNFGPTTRLGLGVISEGWARDLQVLLTRYGIYARRSEKQEKRDDRHNSHVLDIALLSERIKFAQCIGFVSHVKTTKLLQSLTRKGKSCPDIRYSAIDAITPVGEMEVYDIQTESGQYLSEGVLVHNCFINSVDDTMASILSLAKTEGMLFKFGSGTGTNFSTIRSSTEKLNGGGTASGPVSFLRGLDQFAGAIKSGGKTRRAAKMNMLDMDHPDIEEFILSKSREEKKAWALIDAGYSGAFNVPGGAYDSVLFQNANHSVRVSDDFMRAYERDEDFSTKFVTTGKNATTYKARDLMAKIGESAWICGDPGMQYDTTINKWHTCKNSDRIYGSNPCCVTGDTLVAVADGRNAVAMRDLVGTEVPVYAHNHATGRTVVSRMWNIGVKRENAPIYRVTLDDGSSFRATDDHLIMQRDGSYRMVRELKAGDSLMPFHSKVLAPAQNRTRRRHYWAGRSWLPQYRAVWEAVNGTTPDGFHIHHRDFNALNDTLDNLLLMPADAHNALHGEMMCGDNNPARRLMRDAWRKNISAAVTGANNPNYGNTASEETRRKMRDKSAQRWASDEAQAASGDAIKAALAKAKAEGRPVGRPQGQRFERSCPVCRAAFQTPRIEQIFCGSACRYSPMGLQMSGEKTAAQNRGRSLSADHKAKLSASVRANSDPETKRRAAQTSHRNTILKVARLLLDNGMTPTVQSWNEVKAQAEALGASRFPTAATVARHFDSDAALREEAELYNHKVVSVEFCGNEDVFDGTVDTHHNFAILTSEDGSCVPGESNYSGIFIHNSEYMFLNDSACNLASLNLMKFRHADGEFDVEAFKHASRIMLTAQEIIVDNASYPTPRIGENSRDYRPLGLGYANLGALLMARGLAYDSDEGRAYAGAITALMTGEAYHQSAIIARDHGWAFPGYAKNREPFLEVMQMHRDAVETINPEFVPDDMIAAARKAWDDAISTGKQHGYRNAQATVLAPTGTIGFLMDCDTTGIEPDIAIVKYKSLVGGGVLKIVNNTVPEALQKLGYSPRQQDEIIAYIEKNDTIEGAPELKPEHLSVFDCAFKPANGDRSIHYMGHVKMMAAAQPFISGAISKTVNMPHEATASEIEQVYVEGWKIGLKAIAIYRDGSKRTQPLQTKKFEDDTKTEAKAAIPAETLAASAAPAVVVKPLRRKLPDERHSITHKFSIAGHEGYITVGMYEDGTPGEIFLTMSKEGSTISGLMDSFATAISLALQYGVPIQTLVDKFAHARFEPAGYTNNPNIRIAKSITDYIFRWLGSKFVAREPENVPSLSNGHAEETNEVAGGLGLPPFKGNLPTLTLTQSSNDAAQVGSLTAHEHETFQNQADAPVCTECGSLMVRNGACYKCLNCGSVFGCS